MSERELTQRQKEVLDCIHDFQERMNYSPSILEICERLKIRSTNGVAGHIRALIRKGYLERSSKARTLKLTPKAQWFLEPSKTRMVPLLGRIPAGFPVSVEANIEKLIPLGFERKTDGVYALRVTGESMIEDGIFEGDIIFVDSKKQPCKGDIVVALVDGEVTVKRFFPEGKYVELRPANRKMKPIRVPSHRFLLQGVVIGLQRNYD
ncbi:MAG TPA: transcriptional repressor LexA [Candidatus Hydrogenedens sp.]|nr:transcriptional repressor LexA [Candidatus Hydrogenedens sp.]HOL20524.1 transcriptional repressor LexA [Candidatus Hydrogenedens sp.]